MQWPVLICDMGRDPDGNRVQIKIDPNGSRMVEREVTGTGSTCSTVLDAVESLPWLQVYYMRQAAIACACLTDELEGLIGSGRRFVDHFAWWRRKR